MGYKRSMFHKSSSSLGKKFLSGLILGGVLGTAYGAKKMVDKVGEISNDAKPTGDEEIGLGWKIFIHVFLLGWLILGLFIGIWTFEILGMIFMLPAVIMLQEVLKEDFSRKKSKS